MAPTDLPTAPSTSDPPVSPGMAVSWAPAKAVPVRGGNGLSIENDPLFKAVVTHDATTATHSLRVAWLAGVLAEQLGVAIQDVGRLRVAATLHDVGKLSIHRDVLTKPGRFDAAEWVLVRRHPEEGARLAHEWAPMLGAWRFAISQHHERWDGRGYPAGLGGASIALGARIVAIVDAYEAMTAQRPYRRFKSARAARDEILLNSGSQFDPAVVRGFAQIPLRLLNRDFRTGR